MLPTASFAVVGFAALPLLRRLQLEHLLVIAILLTTLGQLGRAVGWNVLAFLVFTCVAMLGIGLVNVVAPPLLAKYFPDRIGLLAAIHVTLLGVSTAVAAQFAIPLDALYGWRFSIGIWAALSALAAVPWLILLVARRTVARSGDHAAEGRQLPSANGVRPWRSAIGWGTALVFAGCSSNTFAALTWLPAVLVDRGLSQETAGSMLALYSILALPVALIVPMVVVRMSRPLPVAVLFVVAFALGYGGIMMAPPASAALWVVIAGLGQGAYSFAFIMINKRTQRSPVQEVCLRFPKEPAMPSQASARSFSRSCTLPGMVGCPRSACSVSGSWCLWQGPSWSTNHACLKTPQSGAAVPSNRFTNFRTNSKERLHEHRLWPWA